MKRRTSWSTTIECPFCSNLIVEAFNFTEVPDDLSEVEAEEFTCGEAGIDQIDGRCEHLAFLSKYPDGWTEVFPSRVADLTRYANSIRDEDLLEKPVTIESVESELDMLIWEDVEILHDYDQDLLSDLNVGVVTIYVEKGDGVKGGGPNYCALFLTPNVS